MQVTDLFSAAGPWTTCFHLDGKTYGGTEDKESDPVLLWQLAQVGGCKGKRILEIGPYEGGHTVAFCHGGAASVIAIEANPNAFVRCLITREVFGLHALFLYDDVHNWINGMMSQASKFDFVCANGVLYHQLNPAKLIHDLGNVTNTVLVWSQVATATQPSNVEGNCVQGDNVYLGRVNTYGGQAPRYSGGPNPTSLWLYPDEMRRCFKDAGFKNIIEKPCPANGHGDCLLFVTWK